MSNPLLLDMVLYLKSQGLVIDDGIDAFRDFTPESPDNVIALHEYPGDPSVPFDPAINRSIQISVRNLVADEARKKALDIFRSLQSDNLIVNFTAERWGQVHLRQTPFRLGSDTSNRTTYCFNIGVTTSIE